MKKPNKASVTFVSSMKFKNFYFFLFKNTFLIFIGSPETSITATRKNPTRL